MQTTAQDLIERAAKYDPSLAADIRAFAKAREFGLVFEHNRPEAMRLYGKKISKGDTVHILASRGKAEKAENRVLWRVVKIVGESAQLESVDDAGTTCFVDLFDLVAVAAFEEPIYAGLREVGRVERGGDRPYQVVINGENYHALEALLFAYAGRADCIYIDPPYNTGARDWKYNNDYVDSTDQYRHSKWLAFMECRLRLAKELLNPQRSLLICTIDEKEYLNLGLLLEQVFPSARIQMISSVINHAGTSRVNEFSNTNEFIYFVMIGTIEVLPSVTNEGRGEKVLWDSLRRHNPSNLRPTRPSQFYPIYVDNQSKQIVEVGDAITPDIDRFSVPGRDGCDTVFPVNDQGVEMMWGVTAPELRSRIAGGYVRVGRYYPNKPQHYSIQFLSKGTIKDIEEGRAKIVGRGKDGSVEAVYPGGKELMPPTQWDNPSHDAYRHGTNILKALLPNRKFPYPKALYAIEDCLQILFKNDKEFTIIDFFSGSGTTAHATMRLNHQDGGSRRCICITNNEVSEAEAKKMTRQGLRQGDPEWEQYGICEYITKPRIEAAITGLTPEGNPVKGDYKFTDEFPMADGFEENAIFFDLTYQNPVVVDLDGAYEEIAPLLWMRAGCKGPIIVTRGDGTYELSETYAILFDYAFAQDFVMELDARPEIQTVYVVTDDEGRYQSINQALKGRDVVQLYESYLRSFQIAAEGALI